jgi:S-adenosylmethionine hydrolase
VIVALLTDFGTRDHYVGTMKGVVLSVCPDATLVDITHDIPPQDILAAALELEAAYQYFPPGTVFLVVVDPGVGSSRRAIAADAGGYRFVGPDNGVLSLALRGSASSEPARVVELKERKFSRPTISKTFEGRDRFAPAAGWLARGTELAAFGPTVSDPIVLDVPVAKLTPEGIEGQVLRVDRFGNLITNIHRDMVGERGHEIVVAIAGETVRVVATYADVEPRALCALVGSTGYIEVAVNGGNAADVLKVGRGESVTVGADHGRPLPSL